MSQKINTFPFNYLFISLYTSVCPFFNKKSSEISTKELFNFIIMQHQFQNFKCLINTSF
jgi:hypothetical protein